MQKEEFLILPNTYELKLYLEYNFNAFILPLEDYSIGYNVYFGIDEINELSKSHTVYVMMNKLLHKKIYDFEKIYPKFNDNVKFIVEDIGLVNIIDKDRLVLYENHILSNYKAINYLSDLGINNVCINNDLTITEIKELKSETKSNLFYHYVAKNIIMYSRRNLVSNFNKHFNIDKNNNSYLLNEEISKKVLEIKEETDGSVVRYSKIFCASKYLNDLDGINKIIDLTDIDPVSTKLILEEISNTKLCDLIDSDYYFLENPIKYKVGDLK